MLGKLALRNIKRQIGNYLIYFITVSITVALMFAINNIIFSAEMMSKVQTLTELKNGLIAITVFVAVIVAFILGYATSFMLKLRKREFGTYLTLGMTRKNILSIFLLETMIFCLIALIAGILLGLALFQGLMAVVTNIMELEFAFASYSGSGLLLTIILVFLIFALSSVASAVYLKKVSVYNLIHGEQKVEQKVKLPALWLGVTLASLAAIVFACILFYRDVQNLFITGGGGEMMVLSLIILAISLITFHTGLSRSVVNLLLKNKKFCLRGANTFTLRQLSGKLGANSVMAGLLAFLISFAVIGANVSFCQKASVQASLDMAYPFDINANYYNDNSSPLSFDEAEEIIEKYTDIKHSYKYNVYTSKEKYLHSFTPYSGEIYESLYDCFMTESEFNRLNTALGRSQIKLSGEFAIAYRIQQMKDTDFSSAKFNLGGKTYSFAQKLSEMPIDYDSYFLAIIPDEAAANLIKEAEGRTYTLAPGSYDAHGLVGELSYLRDAPNGNFQYEVCDFRIKEYGRGEQNSIAALFILSALYFAVVFVFMAMAVLAIKTLSGISDDRRKYAILHRLGADKKTQCKTLFWQTFSFFFLPFALPLLLSIPAAVICAQLMSLAGFVGIISQVIVAAAVIAMILIALFTVYFTATYLIAKRNIIYPELH